MRGGVLWWWWWVAIIGLCSIIMVRGIPQGTHREDFQQCLGNCLESEACDINYFPKGQSLMNRVFSWDCRSECKYRCMWIVETARRAEGGSPLQYYGKWPFPRVAGIQEVGSTLMSLGNLAAHLYGYYRIYLTRMGDQTKDWFLHRFVHLSFIVALNGWLWSTIFHSRELDFTMHLDYFSAIAIVFSCLMLALVRCLTIRDNRRQLLVAIPLVIFYIQHVHYMLMINFDFLWNMKVAISAGIIFMLSFITWSIAHLIQGKRPHAKWSLIACLAGIAGALLEVFDFAPIFWIFDAHCLWHIATIPIIIMWYKFYVADAQYDLGLASTEWPRKRSSSSNS